MNIKHEGPHIYEKWYPYDRATLWRRCVIPSCGHFETKKATS